METRDTADARGDIGNRINQKGKKDKPNIGYKHNEKKQIDKTMRRLLGREFHCRLAR
jgi:low affinity Fe/Cu permease